MVEEVEKMLEYHDVVGLTGTYDLTPVVERLRSLGYRVERDDATFGYLVYKKIYIESKS